ncbi:MAG: hypothetical protein LBK29_02345 [Oscillospiraceae bacterium]|nr:hypothetical protein [Oscillospiraceae bacterium]
MNKTLNKKASKYALSGLLVMTTLGCGFAPSISDNLLFSKVMAERLDVLGKCPELRSPWNIKEVREKFKYSLEVIKSSTGFSALEGEFNSEERIKVAGASEFEYLCSGGTEAYLISQYRERDEKYAREKAKQNGDRSLIEAYEKQHPNFAGGNPKVSDLNKEVLDILDVSKIPDSYCDDAPAWWIDFVVLTTQTKKSHQLFYNNENKSGFKIFDLSKTVVKINILRAIWEYTLRRLPDASPSEILQDVNFLLVIDTAFKKIEKLRASDFLKYSDWFQRPGIVETSLDLIWFRIRNNAVPLSAIFIPIFLGIAYKPVSAVGHVAGDIFSETYKKVYDWFTIPKLNLAKNPVKTLKKMNSVIQRFLKGQSKAIEECNKTIVAWKLLQSQDQRVGSKLILLTGGTGVGKSDYINLVSKCVFGKATNPRLHADLSELSTRYKNDPSECFSMKNPIFEVLKRVCRDGTVIVIEEIDKANIEFRNIFFEYFRNAADTGIMMVRGLKDERIALDVSKCLFFFTSNELTSPWGIPDSLRSKKDNARKKIPIDSSMSKRFAVIEFDYLNEDAFVEILKSGLDNYLPNAEKKFKLNILIKEKSIKAMAKFCKMANRGARVGRELLIRINGAIIDFQSKNPSCKDILISFDGDEIIVEDRNGNTAPS